MGTQAVEELYYYGPPFHRDAAYKYFQKNKASLTRISVSERYTGSENKLRKLLHAFLKLPALQKLDLDCNIPEDIQAALDIQGVYWDRGIYSTKS